jgi:hypothetical protein
MRAGDEITSRLGHKSKATVEKHGGFALGLSGIGCGLDKDMKNGNKVRRTEWI